MNELTRIPGLAVLAIDGPDAAAFLQGQATCDTRLLSPQRGLLGALCNLQGRMIVSFHVLPSAGGLHLLMPADRVAAIRTHLGKYAVFSKVTLRSADELAVLFRDDVGHEPFSIKELGSLSWLALRGDRALAIAPAGDAGAIADGNDDWRARSILAGELLVGSATADRFLPQALNYDVIDGVNFRKGCYTGQEVVARMHFKGRMKERLYALRAAVDAAPAPGTAVLDADGHTVGEVVDAVSPDGSCLVGAVIRHEAMQAGGLRIGSPEGAPLAPLELPYAIPH